MLVFIIIVVIIMENSSIKIHSLESGKPKEQASVRLDGFSNIMTGIGARNSRVNRTFYDSVYCSIDQNALTDIYRSNGMGRRVVNLIVDDAMRTFIQADNNLLNELSRVQAKQHIVEAATWGRLYGGSVLVAFIDDGKSLDKQLDYNKITRLAALRSYDRYQVSWLPEDLSKDLYDGYYGEPEVFMISPLEGDPFRVHRSRLQIFSGARVPNRIKAMNNYWDDSVIQAVYESLRNYCGSMNASAEIIQDFIQSILSVNGLQNMIAQGAESCIAERIKVLDLSRSVAKMILLDAENENYTKQASSVSGLSDLIDRFAENICATTDIPFSKLTGRSPAGLGSTSHNDLENWDNVVEAYRTDEIAPKIDWLVDILEAQRVWAEGKRPTNFEWEFPPLKVANELEIAEIKLKNAQVDAIYMDRGAVDPRFMFEKRYEAGSFEADPFIDPKEIKKYEPDELIEVLPENGDLIAESSKLKESTKKEEVRQDDVQSTMLRKTAMEYLVREFGNV